MTAKDKSPKPSAVANHHAAAGGSNGAKPCILIVDDNTDAANSLGRLLNLMGYKTCVVHDGPTALSKLDEFRPAVVLLDLGMPGMDGLETAERMHCQPSGRNVVLIAVTGWGQESDRQRTTAAGFFAHLTKPVNIDQLEAALNQVLNRA